MPIIEEPGFRDDLDDRLRRALDEDLGPGDVTSEATIPAGRAGRGVVRAKAAGVFCGAPVAARVFRLVDASLRVEPRAGEGEAVAPGREVLRVEGPLRAILAGERLALNFLQRMSGVATLTRRYVDALPPGATLEICDTRKTLPLWRDLDRYAVRRGGGRNHRWGLWDMIMIKDTHADACGGLAEALARARQARPSVPVAAEARTPEEARIAARAGVDLLMLDNMDDATLESVVAELRGGPALEVTGGVAPGRLARLARLGIHRVSVGALTHSAPALDLSLTLESP